MPHAGESNLGERLLETTDDSVLQIALKVSYIASDLLGVTVSSGGEVWAVGKKHFVLRRSP